MRKMTWILAGGAGLAALATAAPTAAQYPYSYGVNTQAAAQQCAAAVQNRLSVRTGGILGVLGLGTQSQGRVLSVTRAQPRGSYIRVRGLATSNAYASNNYGPYGMGAYGALGYAYAQPRADLSFKCDVDYRGYVRDVDINRR